MSNHTEQLTYDAATMSPDEDNFEEKLLEEFSLFRDFAEALTAFIGERGYAGDLNDVHAKASFLREKFKSGNVKSHRDYKEFFIPNKKYPRETAYRICFALSLSVEETRDFFRRVQFERSFDCHTVIEAVYYYCIKNGLSYSEAQDIIKQIDIPQKMKMLPEQVDILYTGTILEYINSINDSALLIQYINENIHAFQYNNVTVIKYIRELWHNIAAPDGIAVKEGEIINRYNLFEDRSRKGVTDTRSTDEIKEDMRYQKDVVKPNDSVVVGSNSSAWKIFAQIMGLKNDTAKEYSKKYDRRLAPILSRSALMPLRASYCFPSQHGIEAILRGEMGDNETMRKMLIFLVFYSFWAKLVVSQNNLEYSVKPSDSERCLDTINGWLLSAGYPELYAGNPYDWLFMWVSADNDQPLEAFRTYMGYVLQ